MVLTTLWCYINTCCAPNHQWSDSLDTYRLDIICAHNCTTQEQSIAATEYIQIGYFATVNGRYCGLFICQTWCWYKVIIYSCRGTYTIVVLVYSQYPQLKLRFLNTKLNLADYLSRNFSINNADIKRIPFKNYTVPDLDQYIDSSKSFSIPEWKEFVNKHLHLLKIVTPDPTNMTVLSLNKTVQDINKLLEPIKAIKNWISFENIAKQQKDQFNYIITQCIKSSNQACTVDGKDFKYQEGMLYCFDQGVQRIYVPRNLEGLLIAHFHLAYSHAGLDKLQVLMYAYYFPQKVEKLKNWNPKSYWTCLFLYKF